MHPQDKTFLIFIVAAFFLIGGAALAAKFYQHRCVYEFMDRGLMLSDAKRACE